MLPIEAAGMKQSSYRYVGLLDLALVGVFLAVFGPGAVVHSPLVSGIVVAGVTLLLAGTVSAVRVGQLTLTWRHLVAISYGVFGIVWPASFAPDLLDGTAAADVALFVGASVCAVTLLFQGYDVLRDGPHFDIEADVETVIGT